MYWTKIAFEMMANDARCGFTVAAANELPFQELTSTEERRLERDQKENRFQQNQKISKTLFSQIWLCQSQESASNKRWRSFGINGFTDSKTRWYSVSGCGSVGREVASDTRSLWFESSHRQILSLISIKIPVEKTLVVITYDRRANIRLAIGGSID